MAIEIRGLVPLLQVFDMPTSISFYRGTLGFEIVQQSSPGDDYDWVLLRLNDAEIMLNTAYEKPERPSTPDHARTVSHRRYDDLFRLS